jgi:type II secretory pathway pseudopilin PulG
MRRNTQAELHKPGHARGGLPRFETVAGFGYVGVLITLAIIGILAAASLKLGAVVQRRQAEAALLEAGAAISEALNSYALRSRSGEPDAPLQLEELLRDPRFPGVVRHLRSIPADPITGLVDWVVERDEDGGRIIAVHSRSRARPIKVAEFDPLWSDLAGKASYEEWRFVRRTSLDEVDEFTRKGLISPGSLNDGATILNKDSGPADVGQESNFISPRGPR